MKPDPPKKEAPKPIPKKEAPKLVPKKEPPKPIAAKKEIKHLEPKPIPSKPVLKEDSSMRSWSVVEADTPVEVLDERNSQPKDSLPRPLTPLVEEDTQR